MVSDTGPTTQQLRRCVYMDVCALNRPLDDQNQMRIRLEADAAHAALAEEAGCAFVTVDDRLLRQLQRASMSVWCGNPVAYCEKEGLK